MHIPDGENWQQLVRGEPFQAADPELVAVKQHVRQVLAQFNRSPSKGHLKQVLGLFAHVGPGCRIEAGLHVDLGLRVSLGQSVYINAQCVLLDAGRIHLADHVLLGPGVHIYAVEHDQDAGRRRQGIMTGRPVHIGENAWIGGGSIILPGVSIGADAIVGAGSVVTADVPAGVTVYGNPARASG